MAKEEKEGVEEAFITSEDWRGKDGGGEGRRKGNRERGRYRGRGEEGEKLNERTSPGEGTRGCRTEAAAEA